MVYKLSIIPAFPNENPGQAMRLSANHCWLHVVAENLGQANMRSINNDLNDDEHSCTKFLNLSEINCFVSEVLKKRKL